MEEFGKISGRRGRGVGSVSIDVWRLVLEGSWEWFFFFGEIGSDVAVESGEVGGDFGV